MLRSVVRTMTLRGVALRAFTSSSSLRGIARSTPSPIPSDPKDRILLPDQSEWRNLFTRHRIHDRISVSNPDTAATLAEAFVPSGSTDKVVIEAFPGPGTLTRALLALPKERLRKLIVVEDDKQYLQYLYPLADIDPRLIVIPRIGFAWDAYKFMEDSGELNDITAHPWASGLHPHLQFISHLPLVTMGEQFVAQVFRCIPEQTWLFKYGRVPVNFIMSEWVWSRVSASRTDPTRCKLTVIAEATADARTSVPPALLAPYNTHFHPVTGALAITDYRHAGTPFVAVDIHPSEKQAIGDGMLDKWDFCLRRLFVTRNTPLKTAIRHLAPGAQTLTKAISKWDLPPSQQVDVTKSIRQLTVRDWALLLKAFDEWPFAPEDLLVTDGFMSDDRKMG